MLVWIGKTDKTLDELKPVAGDPQILEVELAKLKVLVNDIQAHQTSVDTLNDAGRQIIESGEGKCFLVLQFSIGNRERKRRGLICLKAIFYSCKDSVISKVSQKSKALFCTQNEFYSLVVRSKIQI